MSDRQCGVFEDLTSAISLGFIAWLDLGLAAVSLRHDVLVVLAAGVLHQLRVRLEYEGDRECPVANIGLWLVDDPLQRFNWRSASRTPSEPSFRI